MKLEPLGIKHIDFVFSDRSISVYHDGGVEPVTEALGSLQMGSSLLGTEEVLAPSANAEGDEKKMLRLVLLINFGFFILEAATGVIAHSMGLVADSLDMLADALIYGLSLSAVGAAVAYKKMIGKTSGYLQLGLAVFGLLEVVRRVMGFGDTPGFKMMIIISALAFIGNYISLVILRRSKSQDVHIKASQIFTSNDILANIGVIAAGLLVYLTQSRYPDLIVGSIIFLIVARGSYRILQLSK